MSWVASLSSSITGYVIDQQLNGSGPWTQVGSPVSSGTTMCSVTNLTANTSYRYQVAATSSVGTSIFSNIASATTASASSFSGTLLGQSSTTDYANSTTYSAGADGLQDFGISLSGLSTTQAIALITINDGTSSNQYFQYRASWATQSNYSGYMAATPYVVLYNRTNNETQNAGSYSSTATLYFQDPHTLSGNTPFYVSVTYANGSGPGLTFATGVINNPNLTI